MKIFITGATGYIGNHLAMRLANEGNIIHALCRSSNKMNLLQHENIRIFEGDINNISAIEKALQGCEQVYHLAAFARVWAKYSSVFYEMNVTATKNILDAARKAGVAKIVFTSTAAVMGPSKERPVKEDDPRANYPRNEYEISKTAAEELCRSYVKDFGMNIVIVNPPRVFGPGIESESNAVSRLVKLYLQRKWKVIPGDGKGTGSYVHVLDVVNGHVLAMQKGMTGERYILGGENISYNQFFKTLAEVSGIKVKLFKLPLSLMMFAGYAMMLRTKLTGKAPLLTPVWIKKYYYDWSLSSEKAQRELGYTFRPFREGLKETVDWMKNKLQA